MKYGIWNLKEAIKEINIFENWNAQNLRCTSRSGTGGIKQNPNILSWKRGNKYKEKFLEKESFFDYFFENINAKFEFEIW